LLEIGSGTGKLLAKCKQIGWNAIGIEPNSSARKIAKEVNGIELLKDITELQLKNNSVEIVMMRHVLENIANLNESLKKTSALLKTNGMLIIGVPNYKSYDATKYKENWGGYDVPRCLSHFQKSSL
jgi:ubiquinone/menaquinone biosynthesis C-methylase UbiE